MSREMKEEKLQKSSLKFLTLLKNLQIFCPAFTFVFTVDFQKTRVKFFKKLQRTFCTMNRSSTKTLNCYLNTLFGWLVN